MKQNNTETLPGTPAWLTPDFYSRAYDRFIRLRWNIDPFPGLDYHLDPGAFTLSSKEQDNTGFLFWGSDLIRLSSYRLIGEINGMGDDIFKLKTWEKILPEYDGSQKLQLISEFVEPLLKSCVIVPYAVKNQIIFTATKIAVLLEKGKRHPRIPTDKEIKSILQLKHWAGHWKHFDRLEVMLRAVNDDEFLALTKDFRHRYTHRLPPRIWLGITPDFHFEREGKGMRIYPRMEEPLELPGTIEASVGQHRACVTAFRAFWEMLKAKLVAI